MSDNELGSIATFSKTLSRVIPRREFIGKVFLLVVGTGVFNMLFRPQSSYAIGQAYQVLDDCTGVGSAHNSNCGNAGDKPESFLKPLTGPNDPCCNCQLINGCPAGTSPGGSWVACCTVDGTGIPGRKGRLYVYQDCCGPAPGDNANCPVTCFQANGTPWAASTSPIICATGAHAANRPDWCSSGTAWGTLTGSATGDCCVLI
jgi:hypothetical protein